jgi:glutamate-1-semialdehyde 2,1-aminomutase
MSVTHDEAVVDATLAAVEGAVGELKADGVL